MLFKYFYETPEAFSNMWMNSDGEHLTGLWFEGSRDSSKHSPDCQSLELPVFDDTIRWLDIYFSGKVPDFMPSIRISNLTPFRQEVIDRMLQIPYGEVTTYGNIAASIAAAHGIAKMSSRAVGGAVGWNPICIIIPCHRVLGANRSLTGYGGGLKNKISLLKLEGIEFLS